MSHFIRLTFVPYCLCLFIVNTIDCDSSSNGLLLNQLRNNDNLRRYKKELHEIDSDLDRLEVLTVTNHQRFIRSPALDSARPRVQLARRPKSTTTTSTTTSTTSTTSAPAFSTSAKGSPEDESLGESVVGDYEDIIDSSGTTEPKPVSTKAPQSGRNEPEPSDRSADDEQLDEMQESESEPEPEDKESEPTSTSTTTTTTTTTARPTRSRKPSKGESRPEKSASSSGKGDRRKSKGDEQRTVTKSDVLDGNTTESDLSSSEMSTKSTAKKQKKKPLVALPFIKPKNASVCTPEAYLEFPHDLIGNKWRGRGLVLIHILIVCYMFYSLALVCERYFMPSLEEFALRLNLSEDVAGATLMSAGSSAPELFTAILGVFVAKGDVGTGAIVGSAVFNILFVIGICAFVTTSQAQLNWWPVLRDSVFYTFTVLVLILFIYDERITALESFLMIALYGVYILIMANNDTIKQSVTRALQTNPITSQLLSSAISVDGPDDVFGSTSSTTNQNYQTSSLNKTIEDDSMYLAALLVIVKHKRLFRSQLRFQSAARYIIIKRQHKIQNKQSKSIKCSDEVNYFGPESEPLKMSKSQSKQRERMEAYAKSASASKSKFSIVSKDDYEFWNRPPDENENYYIWLAKIPVNYVLHYTIPDCTLYPDRYLLTFCISIVWTALFSYIMVWMVTLIGYTFGIPDSVMGVTFLAAGTSVPDCYSSIHAARNGMTDMAVSNSIGSNVFDILIGLSLPWFIQTAIYPNVVATINSRGVIYSVILLFLSLIVTIYLLNKYEWSLKPRLGLALLIAYGLFIILTCMLEFNLFGHVNPPPCPVVD